MLPNAPDATRATATIYPAGTRANFARRAIYHPRKHTSDNPRKCKEQLASKLYAERHTIVLYESDMEKRQHLDVLAEIKMSLDIES